MAASVKERKARKGLNIDDQEDQEENTVRTGARRKSLRMGPNPMAVHRTKEGKGKATDRDLNACSYVP